MELNSKFIQLSGRAEIPDDLDLGHSYQCMVEMEVHKVEEENNQDGTKNKCFKMKPTGHIGVMEGTGIKTVAKVKGSMSKKWKWEVEKVDSYEEIMGTMLNHPEEIIDFVIELRNKYGK